MFIDVETLKRYVNSIRRVLKAEYVGGPAPHAVVVPSEEIQGFGEFAFRDYTSCVLTYEVFPLVPAEQLWVVVDFEVLRGDRAMVFPFLWPQHVDWLTKLLEVRRLGIASGPRGRLSSVLSVAIVNAEFEKAVKDWISRRNKQLGGVLVGSTRTGGLAAAADTASKGGTATLWKRLASWLSRHTEGRQTTTRRLEALTRTWMQEPGRMAQFICSWSEQLENSVARWGEQHRQMCVRIYRELRVSEVRAACAGVICAKCSAAYDEGKLHSEGIRRKNLYVLVYAIPYGVQVAVARDFKGSYVEHLWERLNYLGSQRPAQLPRDILAQLAEGTDYLGARTLYERLAGALRTDFVNILVFLDGDRVFSTLVLVERMDLAAKFRLPVHVIPEALCSDREEDLLVRAGCTVIRTQHDPIPSEVR